MITKTLQSNLRKILKSRLGINNADANSILTRNWITLPLDVTHTSVGICAESNYGQARIDIYNRDSEGYYQITGSLDLIPSDLERWKAMSIEDAHSLPDDFRTVEDNYQWIDGRIVDAGPRDEDSILVAAEDEFGEKTQYVMLADINDAPGTLSYASEYIGKRVRLCVEGKPFGDRELKAGQMPILEMIHMTEDMMHADVDMSAIYA